MSRPKQTVLVIPITQLVMHPGNIRDDLGDLEDMARSVRQQGIVQPLTVTEHPSQPDLYRIVDGHRRFNAALLAHESRVPVIVRHDLDEDAQTVLMLVTGTHRREVNAMERARGYGRLHEAGWSMSDIAREIGCKPSTVSYYLNLLRLPEVAQEQVETGDLPIGEAIATVREQRQAERVATDKPLRGRPPVYFGLEHPLAPLAAEYCRAQDNHRQGYGGVACGACWEDVIRQDALATRTGAA